VAHRKVEARVDRLAADLRHLHAQRRQERLLELGCRRLLALRARLQRVAHRWIDALRRRGLGAARERERDDNENVSVQGSFSFFLSPADPASLRTIPGYSSSVFSSVPCLSMT